MSQAPASRAHFARLPGASEPREGAAAGPTVAAPWPASASAGHPCLILSLAWLALLSAEAGQLQASSKGQSFESTESSDISDDVLVCSRVATNDDATNNAGNDDDTRASRKCSLSKRGIDEGWRRAGSSTKLQEHVGHLDDSEDALPFPYIEVILDVPKG